LYSRHTAAYRALAGRILGGGWRECDVEQSYRNSYQIERLKIGIKLRYWVFKNN
jgi:hypothetical protein